MTERQTDRHVYMFITANGNPVTVSKAWTDNLIKKIIKG